MGGNDDGQVHGGLGGESTEAGPVGRLTPLNEGRIDVEVVIATRDRSQRLAAQLTSLRAQTIGRDRFGVIVVDDGSADDTREVLAAEQARGELQLRVEHNARSLGPAGSRNLGWQLTQAPLIAFTDDDCVTEPGWLEAGLAAWDGDPLRFVQGRTSPIGAERDRLGLRAYSYEITELDEDFQTCNIFYPRALIEALGGFDPGAFPTVGEDTDLGWRAIESGARPVFAPAAAVEHAVMDLPFRRALRRGWSWGAAAPLYRSHPALRRKRLLYRVFWNWQHHNTGRAWLALLLPRSRALWPLKAWLAKPWLADRAHEPISGTVSPERAAWYAAVDTVEMISMVRGSIGSRTFVL
jgi:GT2 family glycosyltransferase